jgi:ribonuclease E
MSNMETPAGSPGGPVTVGAPDELPEKMRVHALAKLLGLTSREVLAALGGLGIEVKGAQSSIDRKMAEQVVTALVPSSDAPAAEAPAAPEAPAPVEPDVLDFAAPAVEAPRAAAAALAPVFAPPAPLFQAPTRPSRGRRAAAGPAVEEPEAGKPAAEVEEPEPTRRSRSRRSAEPATGDDSVEPAVENPAASATEDGVHDRADDGPDGADESGADESGADESGADESGADESDEDGARRRRRRGRRGRGRGRGADDEGGEESEESDDAVSDDAVSGSEESDDDDNDDEGATAGTSRRRRRRRRRGSGEDAEGDDDPPGTVTRVRRPRAAAAEDGDGVQSVRGSTRLEAKRQRRRDGRDAGRRRVPILSEAEFLARRESVDRTMVVRERGDRMEIAVLEDEILVEHFVADRGSAGSSMVGNIYLGRVQNVLPSMEAAFVDIGRGRNAVLYAGEVDWDAAGLGGKARRIEQALSSGDPVLVQVTKDPVGHKGARLTTQISLAGRFLVYVPSGGAAGISRKLPDMERKRLKDMLREIVPSEAGVIIRTASEGVSHEALERDVRRLQAQWEVIKERSEKTGPSKPKAPVLLYEEPDLLVKVVRDQFNEDFSRLVVQGDDAWDTLHNYLGHVAPEFADRIHRHVGAADVFAEHRIDEQLLKALDRKVWLPSGGTLVIDRTEAMTVIDVNTGKYTGSGGNLEETVTRNNLESAEEIVRQLRLRDIGGIIVIDFIDMVLEANRDLVLRRLTECLARDRTRHQVAEVTSLGLVQMTRKRVGGGLLEHFSTPCEHCRGRGVLVSAEPVVQREDSASEQRGSAEGNGRRSRGGRGARRSEAPAATPITATPITAAPAAARNGLADVAAATLDVGAPAVAPAAAAEVEVAPAGSTVDVAAETVEEVVEKAAGKAAAGRSGALAEPLVPADAPRTPEEVADAEPPDGRPARRRGRVTRTAGAPAATDGDAPAVVVVTVTRPAEDAAPTEVRVAEPVAVVSTPRRARRTASRPAGPPVAEAGDDPV